MLLQWTLFEATKTTSEFLPHLRENFLILEELLMPVGYTID
jgi:hypothetical protein